MASKICNDCGREVDARANFCPYCKSNTFRMKNEIAKAGDNSIAHKLFYQRQGNHYIISKSKLGAIAVFFVFVLSAFTQFTAYIYGAIIAALVYFLGFAIRRAINHDNLPQVVLQNNDYGLVTDLKHLLLYWQDKDTGEFEMSKTKTATLLVFFIISAIAATMNANFFVFSFTGLVFALPVFIVGYVIHRILTSREVKKVIEHTKPRVEPKNEVNVEKEVEYQEVFEFKEYRQRLKMLKSSYSKKEKNVRSLIEKRFEPPQLTYTRFIQIVDNSTNLFNTQADEISTILDLGVEDSPRIRSELESKFDVLVEIIDKLDELSNELVLTMDTSKDDEVESLMDEMENLTKSVKDYE